MYYLKKSPVEEQEDLDLLEIKHVQLAENRLDSSIINEVI